MQVGTPWSQYAFKFHSFLILERRGIHQSPSSPRRKFFSTQTVCIKQHTAIRLKFRNSFSHILIPLRRTFSSAPRRNANYPGLPPLSARLRIPPRLFSRLGPDEFPGRVSSCGRLRQCKHKDGLATCRPDKRGIMKTGFRDVRDRVDTSFLFSHKLQKRISRRFPS